MIVIHAATYPNIVSDDLLQNQPTVLHRTYVDTCVPVADDHCRGRDLDAYADGIVVPSLCPQVSASL